MTAMSLMKPESTAALSTMSVEELKTALIGCLRVTVSSLRDAAMYIKELENRGADFSDLNLPLKNELRLIAHGQLLPEAVVRFAGQPSLLRVVESLPMPDQEKLTAGEPVLMAEPAKDGKMTHRMVDPREMRPQQIKQVFGRNYIRPESEQVLWLEHQKAEASKAVPKAIGDLHIDKERGGVVVGRKFIPLADLVAAVNVLRK